jgi:hypothetical protein
LLLSRACSDRPGNKRAGGHANSNGALHIHGIKRRASDEQRKETAGNKALGSIAYSASRGWLFPIQRTAGLARNKACPFAGTFLDVAGPTSLSRVQGLLASEYRRECDRGGCLNFNDISLGNPWPSLRFPIRRIDERGLDRGLGRGSSGSPPSRVSTGKENASGISLARINPRAYPVCAMLSCIFLKYKELCSLSTQRATRSANDVCIEKETSRDIKGDLPSSNRRSRASIWPYRSFMIIVAILPARNDLASPSFRVIQENLREGR